MTDLNIRSFDFARDHLRWDALVHQHPASTFFHLANWHSVCQIAYPNFQPAYLVAEQAQEVVGILPAFLISRPFAGKAMISNPFSVSAGPLARSAHIANSLLHALEQQASAEACDFIEVRDLDPDISLSEKWLGHRKFATFCKPTGETPEEILQQIPNRQRAVLRKADAHQLTLDIHKDLSRFLQVYGISLRNLGTPIYPTRYFEALLDYFPDNCCLASVQQDGRDLSAVLCFQFKDTLMPYYGGGIPAARQYHSFPWMYWQLMQYGLKNNLPIFDFGRSPVGSGAYLFKKNLGFTPREMQYSYLPLKGQSVPELDQENSLVQQLTSIWSKLPVPLTRMLGPIGAIYAI